LNTRQLQRHNVKNLEGSGMQPNDINATHRNKKFVVSIMQALEQLKADEFINLFQQADKPEVYQITKSDKDAHTRLFREIVSNCHLFPIGKEHGEIILQALYATPEVSNTNKLLAMLLIGSTLEYDDFKTRFCDGGELYPRRNTSSDFFEELDDARSAFSAGINQSDDVRYLIDKMESIETVYSRHHVESFVCALRNFNFTQSSFTEFYEASSEQCRPMVMYNVQEGLVQPNFLTDLVDNGFVPSSSDIEMTLLGFFRGGDVDAFIKLTKKVLEKSRDNRGREELKEFFDCYMTLQLSEGELSIKKAFIEVMNDNDVATAERNPVLFGDSAMLNLTRAFESGDLDQFSKLITAARKTEEARHAFMPVFMDINDKILRGLVITDDRKQMLSLLRDSVTEQMNNLIEHSQPTPPQKRDSRERSWFDEYPGNRF
jgi:flagellar biosynthesis regulator FlbT